MMSSLVFAGSSQLVALDMWRVPLPVLPIIFTTLVVNLRYLLMGAALDPWFSRLLPGKWYILLGAFSGSPVGMMSRRDD